MAQVQFPQESAVMAGIQKSLLQSPSATQVRLAVQGLTELSLNHLHAQKVFESGLFEKAFERMEEIAKEDVFANQKISEARQSLNELQILMQYLDPEQIAEQLAIIHEEISLIAEPSTHFLKNELAVLKKQWQHLSFLYAFPIVEELRDDSMQNNIFHQIQEKIERSSPQEAPRLTNRLVSFLRHLHAAEEIYLEGKAKSYSLLEKELRVSFEEQVELQEGLSFSNLIADPDRRQQVAALLMERLEERLFGENL